MIQMMSYKPSSPKQKSQAFSQISTTSLTMKNSDGDGGHAESCQWMLNCVQSPADCRPSAWTVNVEPGDMEHQGRVIDLTPKTSASPPHASQHKRNRCDSQEWARSHPYNVTIDSKKDKQVPRIDGNIPSHLQPVDCNDSDTCSQDSASKASDNSTEFVTGTFRFSVPKNGLVTVTQPRAKREFVPDSKKDDIYWTKRRKNNVSARLSRMKRKTMEQFMEQKLIKLEEENNELRHELEALKKMFGDKLTKDLPSALSRSPVSSPSSGLGTSTSSLSSGGSADHSSSSSPVLNTDEDKTQRPPKEKLNHREEEEAKKRVEHHVHFYRKSVVPSVPPPPPPPAHCNNSRHTLPSYRDDGFFIRTAHSSYSEAPPSYGMSNSFVNPTPVNFAAGVGWNWHSPVKDERSTPQSASHAGASFPCHSLGESFPQTSNFGSSEGSPDPPSSPTMNTSSENDSSSNSDHSKFSINGQDEDTSLPKMCGVPLKYRFKLQRDYSHQ
ncbi:uncharacterized protein LOC143280446 [Babylonia areolata]|uniref:uncharacterized protein LOC143280446 n=1 Tax=Babylonia areolata TaxID=304850 RepID=UPI003FD57456